LSKNADGRGLGSSRPSDGAFFVTDSTNSEVSPTIICPSDPPFAT
jgi:hypothetical protein